jgi:L-2-hydroxyglutarate oxidase LhgO
LDLNIISGREVKDMEPNVWALSAIYSPSTGIVDTHGLMKSLAQESQEREVMIAYNTELQNVERRNQGYKVWVRDERKESFVFLTRIFINSAGLDSERVARMVGIDKKEYTLKYCKGSYFRVQGSKERFPSRLIYPTPPKEGTSLGIHTAVDLGGGLRLGPDAEYVEEIDYTVDASKREAFYENVRHFLPFIRLEDLAPDMAGIRPKLQGPGEDFRDFLIREEGDSGFKGFINLIGIDSPGLTCALSIAKEVKDLVKEVF